MPGCLATVSSWSWAGVFARARQGVQLLVTAAITTGTKERLSAAETGEFQRQGTRCRTAWNVHPQEADDETDWGQTGDEGTREDDMGWD